jgi:glucosylceramidase
LKRSIDFVNGTEAEVEISKLPKGLYIVKVNDSRGTYSKKVAKK